MTQYNAIQIKYSVANTAIPELLPGELAYSQAGNNLFIGSPDGESGTVRIGGIYNDGILTANQALVANSTGGINLVYASNIHSYYVNAFYTNTYIVNTQLSYANSGYVNFLTANNLVANSIAINTISTNNINTNIITANSLIVNSIAANTIQTNTINSVGIQANAINVGILLANNSRGNAGNILYSSGNAGNSYWGVLALDSTVVNTSGNFTISGNITFANQVSFTKSLTLANQVTTSNTLTVSGAIADRTGNTGTSTTYLASTGANTVQWKELLPPYYYSTTMNDYTQYGIGWMNVAPNQNAQTLGFRSDVNIPFGAIWILAINDGLVDTPPITIYSPSTRTTPMLWMSIDGTGPYDPDTNPNGQAYWFNITPPPSGA